MTPRDGGTGADGADGSHGDEAAGHGARAEEPGGRFTLLGADGQPYRSERPGLLGGHRRQKIYGRLDCRVALRHLATGRGGRHRVFFADEPTAVAAGYRPCAVCMPAEYRRWKAGPAAVTRSVSTPPRAHRRRPPDPR